MRLVGLMLAFCLAGQPVLCIAHCTLVQVAAWIALPGEATGFIGAIESPGGVASFICHLQPSDSAGAPAPLFVPPYWPGLLPPAVAVTAQLEQVAYLARPLDSPSILIDHPPPTPPPR